MQVSCADSWDLTHRKVKKSVYIFALHRSKKQIVVLANNLVTVVV